MAKTLTIQDVNQFLSKFAPPSLAEDWDNVGLQVGNLEDKLTGTLVSLDVTENVLWEAVEHDSNLLITHHPLFFRPIQCLDDAKGPTRLARLATQMGINILSFHTNLDSTRQGLNDLLAKKLKVQALKPLIPSLDKQMPQAGLGRIGKVSKTRLGNFTQTIARQLKIKNLRYVGDPKHPIQKVAVLTGSGGGYFLEAKQAGADVLVTGDVKYHHALDALGEGITLIDIGHYAGEIGMVPLVAGKVRNFLKGRKSKLKVFETQAQYDPIQHF